MQSKGTLWAGRILTLLVVLFLIFDCGIKLLKLAPAVEATTEIGYGAHLVPVIGAVLLVCLVFYVIPRTSVLGAILLTGYLGGAVASSLRAEKPLFNDLFPILFAVLMWLGIYLREPTLRALVPLRSQVTELKSAAASNQ
jgi:hypothetical protein